MAKFGTDIDKVVDGVYVDSVNGVPGTDWPIGTPTMPVNNLTDALAIATARKQQRFIINDNNNVEIAAGMDVTNKKFQGFDYYQDDILISGGTQNNVVAFKNLFIYGSVQFTGAEFDNCLLSIDTAPFELNGLMVDCIIERRGTASLSSIRAYNSYFRPNFILTAEQAVFLTHVSGFIKIQSTGGNVGDSIILGDGLELTVDASCTAGSINVYGDVKIINNSGGTVVNDYTEQTETAWKETNRVYVNTNGAGLPLGFWPAGASPMGLSDHPLDNLVDAFAVGLARNIPNIDISGSPHLTADIPLFNGVTQAWNIYGHSWTNDFFIINAGDLDLSGACFFDLEIDGDTITGNYASFFNCNNYGAIGNAYDYVGGRVLGRFSVDCTEVYCYTGSVLDQSIQAGDRRYFGLTGSLLVSNVIGDVIDIIGKRLKLTIDASCTAGTINVYGDVKIINNSGGTVVNDYTNKPRAEVPVNITAIAAGETNFLNLATAGFHYTIDDLVLKCADPGVNTINVKLYKLVNGVSTLVDTFGITTASFATYFNMMDLFGQPLLAGDNLKITVQATGGGPYAVTGSYAYRSA